MGRSWAFRFVAVHHRASLPPEILEPVRRQRRVDRGAGDQPMTEPRLDGAGVVPLVGERVATGVAEHVGVGFQLEAGSVCGALGPDML